MINVGVVSRSPGKLARMTAVIVVDGYEFGLIASENKKEAIRL